MAISAQCLDSPSIKQCFKVEVRRTPKQSGVDRKIRRGCPENGRDIKNGGADRTKRKGHGVGRRTPETEGCHQEFFIHDDFHGRKPDGIINIKSHPLPAEELLHPIGPGCPGSSSRGPGSLGL